MIIISIINNYHKKLNHTLFDNIFYRSQWWGKILHNKLLYYIIKHNNLQFTTYYNIS